MGLCLLLECLADLVQMRELADALSQTSFLQQVLVHRVKAAGIVVKPDFLIRCKVPVEALQQNREFFVRDMLGMLLIPSPCYVGEPDAVSIGEDGPVDGVALAYLHEALCGRGCVQLGGRRELSGNPVAGVLLSRTVG